MVFENKNKCLLENYLRCTQHGIGTHNFEGKNTLEIMEIIEIESRQVLSIGPISSVKKFLNI